MHKVDECLNDLIVLGQQQGYLTFSQVNNYLPDEAVNPEKLDNLLLSMEELGLDFVADHEVEERPTSTKKARVRPIDGVDYELSEGGSRRKIEIGRAHV